MIMEALGVVHGAASQTPPATCLRFGGKAKTFTSTLGLKSWWEMSSALSRQFPEISLHSQRRVNFSRRQNIVVMAGWDPKQRKAQLRAESKQMVPLPTFTDSFGMPQPLSQFLQQPAGMKSMLNTNVLEDFEPLGNNVFRCHLPKISVLNREVKPVMDLLVYATDSDCVVEMISCKFEGSDVLDNKIERFSASLRNHLHWQYNEDEGPFLCSDFSLKISIEVHTLPFTMLPLAAVETPGNAVLQAMVDRMVPVFMNHLLEDYHQWVKEKTQDLPMSNITIVPILPTNPNSKSIQSAQL